MGQGSGANGGQSTWGKGGPSGGQQSGTWWCQAADTSGVGYNGTTKICNYTCSTTGKTCNFNGPGTEDSGGWGSNCFGVPYGYTSGLDGKMTTHPLAGPQSFPVNTNGLGGLVDKYWNYSSGFIDALNKAAGGK
jgi:hypothetical protein